MKYSLKVKPYNSFWLSCRYNMTFSLLINKSKTYRDAVLVNDYTYTAKEEETPSKEYCHLIKMLTLENSDYIDTLMSKHLPLNFKNDVGYIEKLKELIRNRQHVLVGVDLYSWIPNSLCWNNVHWDHYSLLNGYDDRKKVFYVLDDDYQGYGQFAIPEDRFKLSIQNAPLEPHGYTYDLYNIPDFELRTEVIVEHAQRIQADITSPDFDIPFWKMNEDDIKTKHMSALNVTFLHQIYNRHKANELLFIRLKRQIVTRSAWSELVRTSREIQNGWQILRNIYVKAQMGADLVKTIQRMNDLFRLLFQKEFQMWSLMINSCR